MNERNCKRCGDAQSADDFMQDGLCTFCVTAILDWHPEMVRALGIVVLTMDTILHFGYKDTDAERLLEVRNFANDALAGAYHEAVRDE